MRITIWIVAAVVVAGLACSLGPDFARYMKMNSM
jgi:hypothetical protein